MKTFKIRQQEIWDTYTLIEAESEDKAIQLAKNGEGDIFYSEYNRQNDMFSPVVEN